MSASSSRVVTSRASAALEAFHEETMPALAQDRRLIGDVWAFLRPHRRLLLLALLSVVCTASLALVRPLIMLYTIDQSIATRDPKVILYGGLAFGAVAIVEQLLQFGQIYATQVLGARSMADLRATVFRFICSLRIGYFDRQPVGRLVTRVTNDVDSIQEAFSSGALNAVGDLVRLVGIVVLMLTLDPKLALIAFAAVPPIALLISFVRRRAREVFREIRGKTARMNANMNEQVSGMAVIQAHGRQDAMAAEFDTINAAYRDANIRSIKYDALQDAAIDAVSAIALASIIVALGYHSVTFGTVVAFSAYLTQFFEPISMLAQRYTLLQSALAGAERVFGLLEVDELDAPVRKRPSDESRRPRTADVPAIELRDVTFSYKEGQDVLHDVSLAAGVGEKVALVGPTGSGKTTVTALLLRLYDVRKGSVFVNGVDVTTMPRHQLRRQFGVVPQDVFLFPGTLADNVAAGSEPDLDRVREVLDHIGALDLFERRERGLETTVLPGGRNFSAGERQLIAFARALYRDAPILILDEATANVDSDTESRVQAALERLLEGRTAIIVAHRLSTIRAADRIVVLQKGRIVEQGTHDELLSAGGLYAALHDLQFSREVS